MTRFVRSAFIVSLGLCAAVFGAGCDDKPAAQSSAQPAAAAEALPAGLIVAQAPTGAKGVAEVRQSAAEGEEVVLRGRIAGSEAPFTEGRAQFQLIDSKIKSCKEMEGDACPTPWDMCCEDKKTVVENSVTIQVVGAEGRPLKAELQGVSGLKPLSEVAVKGKVHKSADGKVVTVDATEMYVTPG